MSICTEHLSEILKNYLKYSDTTNNYLIYLKEYNCVEDEICEWHNYCDKFLKEEKIFLKGQEYFDIFINLRDCFFYFKTKGLIGLYEKRVAEDNLYPKVLIKEYIGKEEDIEGLETMKVYRGTSRKEFESGVFSQSWTLNIDVAKKFAFVHYSSEEEYIGTNRVVLETVVNKSYIFYYNKDNDESEVILNPIKIRKNSVSILEETISK